MSQFKNLISGSGRINRRQFLIMAIVRGFFIGIISFVFDIFFVSYFGFEGALSPSFILKLTLELALGLPFSLAYFIRRGHDFGVKNIFSVLFVLLGAPLYIWPGIYTFLGDMGLVLGGFVTLVSLIYLFYPGNKIANIYGNPPIDTGNPSKIFRYMKTDNWDISSKA